MQEKTRGEGAGQEVLRELSTLPNHAQERTWVIGVSTHVFQWPLMTTHNRVDISPSNLKSLQASPIQNCCQSINYSFVTSWSSL